MVDLPIYLDAQATSRIDKKVSDAMLAYWSAGHGNPHSPHDHGQRAKNEVVRSLNTIAEFIGCLPRELTITSGSTFANNLALKGIEHYLEKGRDKILISAIEHPCILETANYMQKQRGFQTVIIPVTKEGFIDISFLENTIDSKTAIVSVMLGNNEIGTIQEIKRVADITHKFGALFHTDATQAAGRIPLDVLEFDCDMMSISAHKMSGPIGIGALFVKNDIELTPIIHGGEQQYFSSGTISPELCVGFAAACELFNNYDYITATRNLTNLINKFEKGLVKSGFEIIKNGPQNDPRRLPGTTNLTFLNANLTEMQTWLTPYVSFSSRSACASNKEDASHVLEAIGLNQIQSENTARFSINANTAEEEIQLALDYFQKFLSSISKSKSFKT